MNDLPSFEIIQPPETTQVPPKKPRPKPARKAARPRPAAAVPKRVPKKRKAKRVVPKGPATEAVSRFTAESYRLIGQLMALEPTTRAIIFGIVHGLTK